MVMPVNAEVRVEASLVDTGLRTSYSQVTQFIQTSATDIDIYAGMANSLVDELLEPLNELSNSRLTMIETLLTCHFIFINERTARLETAGPVTAQYDGLTAMVLMASIHGQNAILLDTTNTLSALQAESTDTNKKRGKASVTWTGMDGCEEV